MEPIKEFVQIRWTWHLYIVFLILFLLILTIVYFHKRKKRRMLNFLHLVIFGVFLSAMILLIPVYTYVFGNQFPIRVLISSLYQALQMFVLNADLSSILTFSAGNPDSRIAFWILSAEIILAPFLTFAFVISFFKGFLGILRYGLSFFRNVYIFSELNERSAALAKSIDQTDHKAVFVFTDVNQEDERIYELMEEVEEIHAVFLKKDIQGMNFKAHSKRRKLSFFCIRENETENHIQAIRLIDKYKTRKNTELYVFSSRIECELLLNQKDSGTMKVRRIDAIQSLIYNHLYQNGYSIFEAAGKAGNFETEKPISVHCLVIGMGQHGTEMVKALTWFGQMPHCQMKIDAYDIDRHAEERFTGQCPELMDETHNGRYTEGDAFCSIRIHSGADVTSPSFEAEMGKSDMEDVCYVFVALGSDEANIRTSVALRTMFATQKGKGNSIPKIDAIVYQADEAQALNEGTGIADYTKTPYCIDFIGSLVDMYSADTIIHSDLDQEAEAYHTDWAKTDKNRQESKRNLYQYGYYYRSSLSVVIHNHTLIRMLTDQGLSIAAIKGMKPELNRLEHCRWNAYTRAEGYRYGEENNRLGKRHKDLVPFDELPEEEKAKDNYLEHIIRKL